MAANKAQGRYLTAFVASLAVTCAGLAGVPPGVGKLVAVLGAVGCVASLLGCMKIKGEEGRTATAKTEGAKLTGALIAGLGWAFTLVGLHFVDATGGRLILALLGIAISLFGIVYVLPASFNKNAFWKA